MAFKLNRSVTFQIWVIGALVPVTVILSALTVKRDFALLWAAARLAASGNASSIYNAALAQMLKDGLNWGEAAIFPYPPHALFFILPVGLMPYGLGLLVWDAASIALFIWAARPYLPDGFPHALSVLTPASLICLNFGQTGLLLGALWLLAFRGKWAAVALLTFKPHLGVLSILSVRNSANLVRVVLLALGLIAMSAILFGPALWPDFIKQVLGHGARVGLNQRWLFAGVGPAMAYGYLGWIPFAVAGVLLLARNVNAFTASTASFLISPFGFHYDMTVASLGFGLLIASRWHEMPIRHRIPAALGFLSPVVAIVGAWWVPPILLWALWAQTKYEVSPLAKELSPAWAAFTRR